MATQEIDKNSFDKRFIQSVLMKLILEPHLYTKFEKFITPEMFRNTDPNGAGVKLARIFFDQMKEKAAYSGSADAAVRSWINLLPDGIERQQIFSLVDEIMFDESTIRQARSEECLSVFIKWLKANTFLKGHKQIQQLFNTGNLETTYTEFDKLLRSISSISNDDVFSVDWDDVLEKLMAGTDESQVQFKLGIPDFDNQSAFTKQMLGMFVAQSGGGKTNVSIHLIHQAIKQGQYVYVACLEDRPEMIQRRLLSNMTGIPINDLKDRMADIANDKEKVKELKKAVSLIKQYVKLDFPYSKTPSELLAHIKEHMLIRKAQGEAEYDVIVIDYMQHIAHRGQGDAMHEKITIATSMLKDFALKNNVLCFTHQQVNRQGIQQGKKSDLITLSELSGSYGAAFVCDVIISLNRTDDMKKKNESVWYVIKGREGSTDAKYNIPTEFDKARYNVTKARTLLNAENAIDC
jgi:replicative DNA helicase